jgi:hypothetical protein
MVGSAPLAFLTLTVLLLNYVIPAGAPATGIGPTLQQGGQGAVIASSAAGLYNVTFHAVGRPASMNWTVSIPSLGQTLTNHTDNLTFTNVSSGTYAAGFFASPRYKLVPATANFSVTNADVVINVSFRFLYNVVFAETGLPKGFSWNVFLEVFGAGGKPENKGGNSTSLLFRETNGTMHYEVLAGGGALYVAKNGSADLYLNGSNINVAITFVHLPPQYNVTFNESGLPKDSPWSVSVQGHPPSDGVSGSPIVISLADGPYNYSVGTSTGYDPTPPSGVLNVNGTALWVNITFAPETLYSLTFTETGLPKGTWSVRLNDTTTLSVPTGSPITFLAPNGSFNYSVTSEYPYLPTPAAGTGDVVGANLQIGIRFATNLFPVTFIEFGLVSSDWWVFVNGTNLSAPAGSGIYLLLRNGSYPFVTGSSLAGAPAVPSIGNLVVAGVPISVSISFASPTPTGTVGPSTGHSQLVSLLPYIVAVAVAVLASAILLRWLARRYDQHEERMARQADVRGR